MAFNTKHSTGGYSLVLDFKRLPFSLAWKIVVQTKCVVLPGSPYCVILKNSGPEVNLGLSPGSEIGSCVTLGNYFCCCCLFLHV